MNKETKRNLKIAFWVELLGGLFGWLWIFLSIGTIVSIIAAIFSSFSWWNVFFIFIGSIFFKQLTREYKKEWESEVSK